MKIRITRRFNLPSLGRHTVCLRKRCAGDASGFALPGEALRPRSQVNRALYGLRKLRNRNEEMKTWISEMNISKSA